MIRRHRTIRTISPALLAAAFSTAAWYGACAQTKAVVAMEVLEEQHVIAEVRIGLEFLDPAKNRAAALAVAEEQMRQAAR